MDVDPGLGASLPRKGASGASKSQAPRDPLPGALCISGLALPWRPSPCPQPSPSCRSPLPGDTRAPKPHTLVRLSDLVLDFSVQRQRVLEKEGLGRCPT